MLPLFASQHSSLHINESVKRFVFRSEKNELKLLPSTPEICNVRQVDFFNNLSPPDCKQMTDWDIRASRCGGDTLELESCLMDTTISPKNDVVRLQEIMNEINADPIPYQLVPSWTDRCINDTCGAVDYLMRNNCIRIEPEQHTHNQLLQGKDFADSLGNIDDVLTVPIEDTSESTDFRQMVLDLEFKPAFRSSSNALERMVCALDSDVLTAPTNNKFSELNAFYAQCIQQQCCEDDLLEQLSLTSSLIEDRIDSIGADCAATVAADHRATTGGGGGGGYRLPWLDVDLVPALDPQQQHLGTSARPPELEYLLPDFTAAASSSPFDSSTGGAALARSTHTHRGVGGRRQSALSYIGDITDSASSSYMTLPPRRLLIGSSAAAPRSGTGGQLLERLIDLKSAWVLMPLNHQQNHRKSSMDSASPSALALIASVIADRSSKLLPLPLRPHRKHSAAFFDCVDAAAEAVLPAKQPKKQKQHNSSFNYETPAALSDFVELACTGIQLIGEEGMLYLYWYALFVSYIAFTASTSGCSL